SHRAFRRDPVPRATIEEMFEVARQAPSWCNTQPWHAYVTEGAATERFRTVLSDGPNAEINPDIAMPGAYEGVHLERRRESGWQLYEAVGVEKGDRQASARQSAKNFELFGAPHAAVITVDRALGAYGVLDAGIFLGYLLLASEALGVAVIPQAAIATRSPVVREFFDIGDDEAVLLGVSFGWSDEQHPANNYRTSRVDLSSIVQWRS
ncbi:nitroreductase, partial [Nocardioides sp. GCM10030258]|uniref:nitroreductase n=1 Tax=unclassified Nocardioides TaxID=2615069 RepID=UPI0036212C38